jgi:hypothetical protein
MPPRHRLARATGCLLVALCCPAAAYQLNYSLDMALGYSDNINQSATDPVGQTMLIPRLDFDFKEEGASLKANAIGQVEYRDYLQGDFGNEVRGQLSGVATWIIVPHRLNFDFEDYAAVQPIDILAPNAPNNQQQTNVFTLGPTFDFRVYQTLNGQADLRLTNSTASETKDFNSNRALGALRLIKDLDPLDQLSANVEYRDIHFTDSSGGPDYSRIDGFVRYQSKLSQLDLDLAGGYSRVSFSGAGDDSGFLGRALLTWRATPSNTFSLGAVRQFADASQDLVVDPAALVAAAQGTGIVVGSSTITPVVYLEKRIQAGYGYQSERFRVRVDPYYKKLDYLLDPALNQTSHGAVAGISYRMRPLWTLAFDATEETRDYSSIDRRDEDLRYDLSFTDQLARQWSVRADLIRNQRKSTALDQGYRENIAFLTLIFKR